MTRASKPIPAGLMHLLTAAVESVPVDARGSTPCRATVKLCLMVLWIYEGRPLSGQWLAEVMGVCDRTAWMAVRALARQGLIVTTWAGKRGASGREANTYTLQHDRISALAEIRRDEVLAEASRTFYRERRRKRMSKLVAA